MSAASLHLETHILDLASVGDLLLTSATRYTRGPAEESAAFVDAIGTHCQNPSAAAVILVFLHGLGFHKETWEPTISHLFELENHSRQQSSGTPRLIEAWAIDCPDHGEAATFNRTSSRVSCLSYGRAVVALLKSGLLMGTQGSRVVLVGHSAGATSLVLAATCVIEEQGLAAIILIEPWMVTPKVAGEPAMWKLTHELARGSDARRDVWNSREDANAYFKSHPAFRHWHKRVRRVYVDHGLRSFPTPEHPSHGTSVTLAFPKRLESEAYGDFTEGQAALEQMIHVSAVSRLYLVFGAQQPSIVKVMQRAICAHAGNAALVTYLPAVGHAAPQQSPALVARTIWDIVLDSSLRESPGFRGKL